MTPSGAVLLRFELADPGDEEAFLSWWRAARRLLYRRFRLGSDELFVVDRGRYHLLLAFPLPGAWDGVARDRGYRELEARRPRATVEAIASRPFHLDGNPRDVTTGELSRRLAERRDLAVVDALSPHSFAARHLPGAVNLPSTKFDAARAEAALGRDRDRPVVVYCTSYG